MKKYLSNIKLYVIIQIIFDAIFTVCIAFIPYLQKLLIDMISTENYSSNSFLKIVMIYLFCIIGGLLFSYIAHLYLWKGAINFEKMLKMDFFSSIFRYKYSDFSKHDIGEYISIQANDITHLEQDYLQPLTDIIKSINIILIYGFILFVYIDWRIAITILFASIITISVAKITSKILSKKRNIYLNQVGEYTSKIKDLLEGFKLINSRSLNQFKDEHEKVLNQTAEKRLVFGRFKNLTLHLNDLTTGLTGILAFITVGLLLSNGEISIGTAVASFSYINSFISPIESLLYDITAINSLSEVKEKVFGHINNSSDEVLETPKTFNSSLELKNINFSHENFSINNFSFTFEKGKKYAIIGHSGSGKSTVLNLLMKYLPLDSGEIKIDGKNINNIDTSYLINGIQQHDHIFKDSFVQNVSLYSSYSYGKTKKQIENINLSSIRRIEDELNCNLLSGGEKQVLSVMRMLSSNVPIYLMDESFSAVDINTTNALQKNLLDMTDKTIIMVTHKISNHLNYFDEILLMKDGNLEFSGHYDEILDNSTFKSITKNLEGL